MLTDIEWSKLYKRKKLERAYAEGLQKDENFIWVIKKDWYGQDHLFLQRNPGCVFYTMFSKIDEFDNVFFDFYPKNAFIRQVRYITKFYLSAKEDTHREFPFLTRDEMDAFVRDAIDVIEAARKTPRQRQRHGGLGGEDRIASE